MYLIKNLEVIQLHPTLKRVVNWVSEEFGLYVVTSAYRPGDPGVHGTMPVRGLDMRCRDQRVGLTIADEVNKKFTYDSERPDKKVAIWHKLHLHLQVHRNTV